VVLVFAGGLNMTKDKETKGENTQDSLREQIAEIIYEFMNGIDNDCEVPADQILALSFNNESPEFFFKAGQKSVVEWVEERMVKLSTSNGSEICRDYRISDIDWQIFKKEQGI
jgi:hypothetical protein